jgi:hypothetical protein
LGYFAIPKNTYPEGASKMTTQPDPYVPGGSWASKAEVDSLRRDLEHHFDGMTARVDKSVSAVEYTADKRFLDLQFVNINGKVDGLNKALQKETDDRIADQKEDVKARQYQFRWIVSAILIPIVLAAMDLMLHKK